MQILGSEGVVQSGLAMNILVFVEKLDQVEPPLSHAEKNKKFVKFPNPQKLQLHFSSWQNYLLNEISSMKILLLCLFSVC